MDQPKGVLTFLLIPMYYQVLGETADFKHIQHNKPRVLLS